MDEMNADASHPKGLAEISSSLFPPATFPDLGQSSLFLTAGKRAANCPESRRICGPREVPGDPQSSRNPLYFPCSTGNRAPETRSIQPAPTAM